MRIALIALGALIATFGFTLLPSKGLSRPDRSDGPTAILHAEVAPPASLRRPLPSPLEPQTVAARTLHPESDGRWALMIEFGPDDPVQVGECTLFLRLIDAETNAPASSEIVLWRLGAPGNDNWTSGDQPVRTARVPEQGLTLSALAAGRYRVVCQAERPDAPDAAPFLVAGERTEQSLALTLARTRAAFAVLYEAGGLPVHEVQLRPGSHIIERVLVSFRPWTQRREPNQPVDAPLGVCEGTAIGGGGARGPWRTVQADASGRVALGEFPCDSREREVVHFVDLRLPAGSRCRVKVLGSDQGERTYVAVFPDQDLILSRLVLPDGVSAHELAADVRLTGGGILRSSARPDRPWLDAPIEAWFEHPMLFPSSLQFTLGQPAIDLRVLALDD